MTDVGAIFIFFALVAVALAIGDLARAIREISRKK